MSLHMYEVTRSIWRFLADRFGHRFFTVLEWCMKTEYQGRGTVHWHIAAWVICRTCLHVLVGRTGVQKSDFVEFLEIVFQATIDVAVGNGRLNYINGYVSKDHDSVDVGLGEYVQKGNTTPWKAAYRLLSKSTPCIPEVAIRMASHSEFLRSYSHVLLYPPQPADLVSGSVNNFSVRMHDAYRSEMRQQLEDKGSLRQCFLVWHRGFRWDASKREVARRLGNDGRTLVVACRYWYELTDGFWGQFSLTQLPHLEAEQLLPLERAHLECMKNFAGAIEFISRWRWRSPGRVAIMEPRGVGPSRVSEVPFEVAALPIVVGRGGSVCELAPYRQDEPVFSDDEACYRYLTALAEADLTYRGFRDDRLGTFRYKQDAQFLLYQRVLVARDGDAHEFELLRQSWDVINRPQYVHKTWSPEQDKALLRVAAGYSHEDECARLAAPSWLYVSGPPGSGKTALLVEVAVRAVRAGLSVVVVCPTGQNAHGIKALLPDVEGIERVSVDTIHGLLGYKRPGPDGRVRWAPPSALRRKELLLCDEGSQYADLEWRRFYQSVQEQPHRPFTVVFADFQQLQPLGEGSLCWLHCRRMEEVELTTVYRSSDPRHLLFLNRIREVQPTRQQLEEYFEDRVWRRYTLRECVDYGMALGRQWAEHFVWFTHTNRGAAEVCREALACQGIGDELLETGYLCDPESKSDLRIIARPGILVRLTRNFDKQRGFVNGAVGVVWESLCGNSCFVVKLHGSGNLVLVYPMEEDGSRFLPCCYGYAMTIRRAQGLGVALGCIYFDQRKRAAGPS